MSEINLDLKEFNPKEAELQTLAQSCETIDLTDLKAVKEKRIELKNARVEITKAGKAMREGATAFAKAVIEREKELIAIIEPKEESLAKIEEEVKKQKEREERTALLPVRKERLMAIDNGVGAYIVPDEAILDLDGSSFEGFFNKCQADYIQKEKDKIEAVKRDQEAQQKKLDDEKNAREREEQARQEEREKATREAKEKEEREAREADEKRVAKFKGRCVEVFLLGLKYITEQNAYILDDFYVPVLDIQTLEDGAWALLVDKLKTEIKRRADEAKAKADEEARLADEKYQAWLTSHDWTPDRAYLYIIKENGKNIELYKHVDTFRKEV